MQGFRALVTVCIAALAACTDAGSRSNTGADSVAASALGKTGGAQTADGEPKTAAEPGAPPGGFPAEIRRLRTDPNAIIRALYVNRFAAQSTRKMQKLIAFADTTEVNALVIDIKDEFGLNWNSTDPMVQKNAGTQTKVANMKALVDTLNAHNILPIARIVVFKDSVASRMNPQFTIRRTDGSAWRDHEGLTWVNPYANAIWEYNFRVAEEAARMGFGEIQFDYIRFPEPYKSLPQQVFPESNGRTKPQALAEFLRAANARMDKLGVRTTADIFGLVTTVKGALEVGQQWETLAPTVDVLLPMVYPSHYPRGSFGIRHPNAAPYETIHIAISRARERNEALGIRSRTHVRPWIQAFTLGPPRYDASHVREQKRAIYDAGYEGWVMWSPGSNYDIFIPALEKTLVSRAKNPPVPPARKVVFQ